MKPINLNRLHSLRMDTTAAGYALQEKAGRFNRLANRQDNGLAPRVVAVHQLFQTPVAVANQLAALLELQPGARILEPSAGLGRLLDAVAVYDPGEVAAVEITAECCAELYRQNRPGVTIKQRDFLTCTTDDLGLFDAVIMNPPFTMRSDIEHIWHALDFVLKGGRLAAICMATDQRREELQPLASQWIELPHRSFGETGTGVDTALLVIQK